MQQCNCLSSTSGRLQEAHPTNIFGRQCRMWVIAGNRDLANVLLRRVLSWPRARDVSGKDGGGGGTHSGIPSFRRMSAIQARRSGDTDKTVTVEMRRPGAIRSGRDSLPALHFHHVFRMARPIARRHSRHRAQSGSRAVHPHRSPVCAAAARPARRCYGRRYLREFASPATGARA